MKKQFKVPVSLTLQVKGDFPTVRHPEIGE